MGAISLLEFFGNQTSISISSDTTLNYRYRFWRVTATPSLTVRWPSNALPGTPRGGPVFFIANVGSNTFTYRDTEGNDTPLTLAAGKALIISTYIGPSGAIRFAGQFPVLNYASY